MTAETDGFDDRPIKKSEYIVFWLVFSPIWVPLLCIVYDAFIGVFK